GLGRRLRPPAEAACGFFVFTGEVCGDVIVGVCVQDDHAVSQYRNHAGHLVSCSRVEELLRRAFGLPSQNATRVPRGESLREAVSLTACRRRAVTGAAWLPAGGCQPACALRRQPADGG